MTPGAPEACGQAPDPAGSDDPILASEPPRGPRHPEDGGPGRGWRVLIWLNLGLGAFLWFWHFTDWSLPGTRADILLPPFALVVAFLPRIMGRSSPPELARRLQRSRLPLLLGGGLPVLITPLLLINCLGSMTLMDEIGNETRIQRITSPDGSRVAEVYFRGVGAYSGGNGRVFVRVRYHRFPILERDVYTLVRSHADPDSDKPYLSWVDDGALLISENKKLVSAGVTHLQIPFFLRLPMSWFDS